MITISVWKGICSLGPKAIKGSLIIYKTICFYNYINYQASIPMELLPLGFADWCTFFRTGSAESGVLLNIWTYNTLEFRQELEGWLKHVCTSSIHFQAKANMIVIQGPGSKQDMKRCPECSKKQK